MDGSEKRNAVFTVVVISALILTFTIADFFDSDRIFSETENRLLASKPEFSREALLDGTYAAETENYVTDQFVSRDKWITVKTVTDVLLQKKEINGVYLGQDDYLIEQHLPEDYTEVQISKKLLLLEKLVERWDAAVMLVPTADNILTDKLPANAPCFDQKAFLDRVEALVGEEHYVDVYNALAEHKDEEIYYRTDHHWTSLGACYGYRAWAEAKGVKQYRYNTHTMKTATTEFLGTLHSKVNLDWKNDCITYFRETTMRPVTVTYDMQTVTDTLYETSYLDTKNKYGFFLDDNHALVEIDTGRPGKGTLFVIKDSYANCLVPLLTPHYSKIYMLDPRYYNGKLFRLMEQYEEESANTTGESMDVLVLYNCIHFLDDFGYYE
ncbi:MAG: DHHW family protein [Acetatifactor sp.]